MRVWSLIATIILASVANTAAAQGNNAAAAQSTGRSPVAVIDVGYILDNHPTLKSQMDAIQAKIKTADEQMNKERQSILDSMKSLSERFTEGTAEYDAEERRITELDADFRLKVMKMKKDFDKQQAVALYSVYTNIRKLVEYYCTSTGTKTVLKVNRPRDDFDTTRPENVQLIMSQELVYYAADTDITNWVLDAVKQQVARAGGQVNR